MRKGENIYKRKDGRWEARYHSGYTETGKPKMKSVYGTTYTEAKAKRNQAIQTQTQPIKGHILTFDELFSSYIKHVQFSVKATTIATYTEWYQKHLSPFFGCNKIDSITTDKVNYFIQQKINTISVNHTLNIMVLFKTLINYAKEAGFMHSNQLNNIVKLTRYETTIRIFTDEEQQKIEHYLTTHLNTLNAGFLLCFYTGLRIGELCALTSADINSDTGIIAITKTMQRIKNVGSNPQTKTSIVITSPKTKASIREIPIPYAILYLIKPYFRKNSFILTGSIEKYIEPRLLENKWKQLLKSVGIPYRKFHTIRHTFATNAIRNRIYDIKTLAEILGHNNIDVTFKKYLHSDIHTKIEQSQNMNFYIINRQNISQQNQKLPSNNGMTFLPSSNAVFYENRRAS